MSKLEFSCVYKEYPTKEETDLRLVSSIMFRLENEVGINKRTEEEIYQSLKKEGLVNNVTKWKRIF